MKSTLLLLAVICNVTTGLGQGRVFCDTHVTQAVVAHVYMPSPVSPGLVQIGNGPSDYPPGATDWTGWTPVSGAGFTAQLFAAPGADKPADSLTPAVPITTFRTGIAVGFVNPVTVTLTGVPFDTLEATVQMRVWDNKGGTVTDWAGAVAEPPGTEILGVSAPTNVGPIGGPMDLAILVGLESFNLTYNVPEPSTLVIAGFGSALLAYCWSRTRCR